MSADLLAAMMAGAAQSARAREASEAAATSRAAAARQPSRHAFPTRLSADGINVIAECKRRSPSKGVLRDVYDPAAIAASYARAGAAAISVLTDGAFFDGSLDHLRAVAEAVDIPVLRKDFISLPYQLLEARAAGANAALLIVAGLDDEQLRALLHEAQELELAALVEVHDRHELQRAVDAGARLIGVNSRNLHTLEVDMHVHEVLALGIPSDIVAVAESGLRTGADLTRLRELGYNAFLVGERFMTTAEPGDGLAELLKEARA